MAKLDLISFPSWDSSVVRASDSSEGPSSNLGPGVTSRVKLTVGLLC